MAAVLSIAATGCGEADKPQSETTPKTSVMTSKATETDSTSEAIAYNGTFNEEVFKQLCNDIIIGNKIVSLPFSLVELGEGFSYDDSPIFDEENQIASAGWMYNNNIIGFSSTECQDTDDDLSNNKIYSIDFKDNYFKKQNDLDYIAVGGIQLSDTKEKLINTLGDPTNQYKFSSGTVCFAYELSEENNIKFDVSADGAIVKISITISKK